MGASNFTIEHLAQLLEHATVVPALQSDRSPPLLLATRDTGVGRRPRHPHPGLVTNRRHHLLPRWQPRQHPQRPSHRRNRHPLTPRPSRGDAEPGVCSTAARAFPSPPTPAGSQRTSTCPTSSCPSTRWPRTSELDLADPLQRKAATAAVPVRVTRRPAASWPVPDHQLPISMAPFRSIATEAFRPPAPVRGSHRPTDVDTARSLRPVDH